MKQLQPTTQFKKDLKRYKHQPKLLAELKVLLNLLINEQPIPKRTFHIRLSAITRGVWNVTSRVIPC